MHSTGLRRARKPRIDWRSQTFTLSHAKTYLGRLVEKAAKGETVYIAKGRRRFVLQQIPEIDPIPLRPPGYFAHCYTAEEIQEEHRWATSSVIRPPKDLE
jgi:hypothetical protein